VGLTTMVENTRMKLKPRMRKRKAEQERRAQQATRRAEEILSASERRMRKAVRASLETLYRVEVLPWRIEGGDLRPRRPRSVPGGGRRMPATSKDWAAQRPATPVLTLIH
jgi:hypothetical protein